jgi:hypothetical protein
MSKTRERSYLIDRAMLMAWTLVSRRKNHSTMATFDKITAVNNGRAGIAIHGNVEGLHLGEVHVEGNGVAGIQIFGNQSLMQALGLPDDTDPKDLADLLRSLQGKGELDRKETAAKHTFIEKYGKRISNVTAFLANLVKISEADLDKILSTF